MRSIMLMFATVMLACGLLADGIETDDVALRSILKTIFLDRHSIKGDLQATLSEINFASNRLVAAAKDVYDDETTDVRQKGRAINVVTSYGTPTDVEFVVSCATNHEYWSDAAIGVLLLSGVTTNSIARVDSLMHCDVATNGVYDLESKKSYVILSLLNQAMEPTVSANNKAAAWNYSMSFASNHVDTIMVTDMALSRFDSTFQNSRRRLALLRYLQPLETIPDLQRYVSDEINKIEALSPESLND